MSFSINCYELEYFNANDAFLIYKNNPFKQLGHLKNLKEVYIRRETERRRAYIIDDVPHDIENKLPNLKSLDCSYHTAVFDNDIIFMLRNSPLLEYLDVRRTNITYETLRYAISITKIRQNDIKLQLVIDKSILNEHNNSEDDSPFLIMLTKSPEQNSYSAI